MCSEQDLEALDTEQQQEARAYLQKISEAEERIRKESAEIKQFKDEVGKRVAEIRKNTRSRPSEVRETSAGDERPTADAGETTNVGVKTGNSEIPQGKKARRNTNSHESDADAEDENHYTDAFDSAVEGPPY